jgi:hypothetical protein
MELLSRYMVLEHSGRVGYFGGVHPSSCVKGGVVGSKHSERAYLVVIV